MDEIELPHQYVLFGNTIKVEHDDSLHAEQDCLGKWHPTQNRILVQSANDTIPSEVAFAAYWHENVHAILDTLGHQDMSSNETLVEQLGQAIAQIILTEEY